MPEPVDHQKLNEKLKADFSKPSRAIFEDVLNNFALADTDKKILVRIYVQKSQQLSAKSIRESLSPSSTPSETDKRIALLADCHFLKISITAYIFTVLFPRTRVRH
jgi:hypothetical protein